MNEKNYDEYINAAEQQLSNEKNNPTLLLVLSELHSGITHYKAEAEKLESELEAAKADMKDIASGMDCCNFCKNTPPDFKYCDIVDLDCEKCTVVCNCRFCTVDTFNFEWRGKSLKGKDSVT